jgi:hypothetical protein
MLCRNVLPPSSGYKNKPNKQEGSSKLNEAYIENMVTCRPGWEPRDKQ